MCGLRCNWKIANKNESPSEPRKKVMVTCEDKHTHTHRDIHSNTFHTNEISKLIGILSKLVLEYFRFGSTLIAFQWVYLLILLPRAYCGRVFLFSINSTISIYFASLIPIRLASSYFSRVTETLQIATMFRDDVLKT